MAFLLSFEVSYRFEVLTPIPRVDVLSVPQLLLFPSIRPSLIWPLYLQIDVSCKKPFLLSSTQSAAVKPLSPSSADITLCGFCDRMHMHLISGSYDLLLAMIVMIRHDTLVKSSWSVRTRCWRVRSRCSSIKLPLLLLFTRDNYRFCSMAC
jgi:hypothetical protein